MVITFTIVFLIVDVYVLYSWQRFVRRMKWTPWLYRGMWIIALLMLLLSPYVNFQRSNNARIEDWMFTLYLFSIVWYIPKLPIALVLLAKDILRIFRWIVSKFRATKRAENATRNEEETLPGRRAVLQASAWGLAGIPFIMVGDGMQNTDNITVYAHDVELPKLPSAFDGLKIVQISDIHTGSFRDARPFQEARRIIEAQRPDLLLITGDFVNFQADELKLIRTELEKLKGDLGVWASLGNHDHYSSREDHSLLKSMVRNSGINLLVNENHSFDIDGEKLQLVGTDNTGLGQKFADLPAALIGTQPEHPTILMAHDPTFWDKEVREKTTVDLMLSGHTHGGQVGMNIMGKEYSFAQLVYKQWAGLYKEGEQFLYVNRGLGTVGPPIRIGIPPEITVITLRKPKATLG